MIKSAYYNGMEKDATSMEQRMRSAQKKKDMKALDRAAKKGIRGPATEEAIKRQPTRAANLGVVSLDNTASTANTIPASFITSESVSSPMYTDTVNVDDAFNSADSPISDTEKQLADANNMLDIYRKGSLANARAQATMLGGTVGGLGGLYLGNKGTKWLNKKLGLTADRGGWRKWLGRGTRLLGTIGSGIGGVYLGGKLGHMGASYGQKRIADKYFNGDQDLMADMGATGNRILAEAARM